MNGGKLTGVPYNCGKRSGTRAKGKMHEELNFNPSVVNSENLVVAVIGDGESGTKKPSVGSHKST